MELTLSHCDRSINRRAPCPQCNNPVTSVFTEFATALLCSFLCDKMRAIGPPKGPHYAGDPDRCVDGTWYSTVEE